MTKNYKTSAARVDFPAPLTRTLKFELLESRRLLSASPGSDYNRVDVAWFASLNPGAQDAAPAERQWIIRLTPEAVAAAPNVAAAGRLLSDLSVTVIRGLGLPGQLLLEVADDHRAAVGQALAADPRIAFAEPNAIVLGQRTPLDPRFAEQVGFNNVSAQGEGPDISAPEAWDIETGSPGVVVGVIDTGVDLAHPDLYLNIWINQGEIPAALAAPGQLVDTDSDGLFTFYDLNAPANAAHVSDGNQNGYIDAKDLLADPRWANGIDDDDENLADGVTFVDDLFGWNFRSDAEETAPPNEPSDVVGHGTHVAGVIAAAGNNGVGVAGLNWRSSLMALKFLDAELKGSNDDAIAAINYAEMMRTRQEHAANVRVLNASWGQTGGFSAQVRDSIAAAGEAGILFVAAAGNGNVLGQGIDNDRSPFYPASYDLPNIISVAASTPDDELAPFSNFGATSVHIAAPGTGVLSTVVPTVNDARGYGLSNGTSMAAPHVAGTAALVWAKVDLATVEEVREAILSRADDVAALDGRVAVRSRLNVHGALTYPGFAPQIELVAVTPPVITAAGGVSQTVRVRYTDQLALNMSTIGAADIAFVRQWGSDTSPISPTSATIVSQSAGNREAVVDYVIPAPGGAWDPLDFGNYDLTVLPGQVQNVGGFSLAPRQFTAFRVQIADPTFIYVNSSADAPDVDPSDGAALDAEGRTTLRAAVDVANAALAPRTIVLEAGRFEFSIVDPPINSPSVLFPEIEPNNTLATAQNLDLAQWTNRTDLNIEESETVPHVSIAGRGDGTFDYYSFMVGTAGVKGVFDIDAPAAGNTFDAKIHLFDADGTSLAEDDGNSPVDQGSTSGLDPRLTYRFSSPGVYVIGIARSGSVGTNGGISGSTPQLGESYTLHVSLPGHAFTSIPPLTTSAGDLDIAGEIKVLGDTPGETVIDAKGRDRVFDVQLGGFLTLSSVTVTGGIVTEQSGGGIRSQGRLHVEDSVVRNNAAHRGVGGGVALDSGEGMITRSTIADNRVQGNTSELGLRGGGGIAIGSAQEAALALEYSSVIRNESTGLGGGIYVAALGNLESVHSTISTNRATHLLDSISGFGVHVDGAAAIRYSTIADNTADIVGAGLSADRGTATLSNSIVLGNRAVIQSNDLVGGGSQGFNILGARTFLFQPDATDVVGAAREMTLGPLADNGGPTLTHMPLAGSAPVDRADPTPLPTNIDVTRDQRGTPRPQDGDGDGVARRDVGAVERFLAVLSGRVFEDRNGDGVRQPAEPGLAGRVVFLDENADQQLGPGEQWTVTMIDDPATFDVNETGRYGFENVPPGPHQIVQQIDPGYRPTGAGPSHIARVLVDDPAQLRGAEPSISGDGHYLVFSTGLFQPAALYRLDLQTGARITLASTSTAFTPIDNAVNHDGSVTAFITSVALSPSDGNSRTDVYVARPNQPPELVSQALANESARNPTISADGRYVGYQVESSGEMRAVIVDRDNPGVVTRLAPPLNSASGLMAQVSADGRYLVFSTNASSANLFLYDRVNQLTSPLPLPAGERSFNVAISSDGRFVAYCTGDDCFVLDRQTGLRDQVNITENGVPTSAIEAFAGGAVSISGDGRMVTFISRSENGRPNQIYLRDRAERVTRLVSAQVSGAPSFGESNRARVNGTGDAVVFISTASDLVPDDTSGGSDVFIRRLADLRAQTATPHAGQAIDGLDFAVRALDGAIRGTVFDDLIPNAVLDGAEEGRAGVVVYLDADSNGRRDVGEPTATTDIDGAYAFTGLAANRTHAVAIELPAQRVLAAPSPTQQGVHRVFVAPGTTLEHRDFALRDSTTGGRAGNATLQGMVFTDSNGDGVFNTGDTPIEGATVYFDVDGNRVMDFNDPRAVSNASGVYSISPVVARQGAVQLLNAVEGTLVTPRGNKLPPLAQTQAFKISDHIEPNDPKDVVLANLVGDALPDAIVALGKSNRLAVLENDGAGGSKPAKFIDLPLGSAGPYALAVGNFNNAGTLDVAVANSISGNVTILLDFNGTTFASRVNVGGVGAEPGSIVAANIDGDGDLDLIVSAAGGRVVTVLLNNGGGGFAPRPGQSQFDTGGNFAFAVAAGHFNGDMILDLAVANFGSNLGGDPRGSVGVLYGTGGGAFQTAQPFAAGISPASVATADFNRDGRADIIVGNFQDNTISILEGKAGGGFTVLPAIPSGGQGPLDVTAADVEGDGDLDLVLSNLSAGVGSIVVLRNRSTPGGPTSFEPAEVLAVANLSVDTPVFFNAVADVSGDGLADIVVADGKDNELRVYINKRTNGGYQLALNGTETLGNLNFAVAVPRQPGDYNGNGIAEGFDFLTWQRAFGSPAIPPGSGADGSNNGLIDAADFQTWKANFGSSLRRPGDYDGNGAADGGDFLLWQRTLGQPVAPSGSGADGDNNGVVDGMDFNVWKSWFGATSIELAAAAASVNLRAAAESASMLGVITAPPTIYATQLAAIERQAPAIELPARVADISDSPPRLSVVQGRLKVRGALARSDADGGVITAWADAVDEAHHALGATLEPPWAALRQRRRAGRS
jgi:subtilisin family serine protease/Tol biopolymer transport system component